MSETIEALARAKQLFEYRNGCLFWKEKTTKKVVIGARAGTSNSQNTYRDVKIDGVRFKEHRVIWAIHNDVWPEYEIDHINNIRDDNRIENLRDVPHRQNQLNMPLRKDNKYGCKGIRWRPDRSKWQAFTSMHGKFKNLGHFDTKEAATDARESYLRDAI